MKKSFLLSLLFIAISYTQVVAQCNCQQINSYYESCHGFTVHHFTVFNSTTDTCTYWMSVDGTGWGYRDYVSGTNVNDTICWTPGITFPHRRKMYCNSVLLYDTTYMITTADTMRVKIDKQNSPHLPCPNDSNGVVQVKIEDGTGAPLSSYSFQWDNGQTTALVTGMHAGYHRVTVTNQFGCSEVKWVKIRSAFSGNYDLGGHACQSTAATTWNTVIGHELDFYGGTQVTGFLVSYQGLGVDSMGSNIATSVGVGHHAFYISTDQCGQMSFGFDITYGEPLILRSTTPSGCDNPWQSQTGSIQVDVYHTGTDTSWQEPGYEHQVQIRRLNNDGFHLMITDTFQGASYLATGLPAGDYRITVVDENGCVDENICTVSSLPPLVVTPWYDATTGYLKLNISGGNGAYKIIWGNKNGLPQVVDSIMAVAGDTFNYTVMSLPDSCYVQGSITAPGTINIKYILDENAITISPNPTSDLVWITLPEGEYVCTIYSITGAAIFRKEDYTNEFHFDLSELPNAIYIAVIESPWGKVTKRIRKNN